MWINYNVIPPQSIILCDTTPSNNTSFCIAFWFISRKLFPKRARLGMARKPDVAIVKKKIQLMKKTCPQPDVAQLRNKMWPALTNGGQSRLEAHEITGENITQGSLYQYNYGFRFLFHIVGRQFYHFVSAHSPFWPICDFKIQFKWQKPTLTTAV